MIVGQDLMSIKLTPKGFNVRSTHPRRWITEQGIKPPDIAVC